MFDDQTVTLKRPGQSLTLIVFPHLDKSSPSLFIHSREEESKRKVGGERVKEEEGDGLRSQCLSPKKEGKLRYQWVGSNGKRS